MGDYPVRQLYDKGLLTDIDIRFADLMARLSGENGGEALYLACVLLNNTVIRGKHVCLDFDDCSGKPLAGLLDDDHETRANARAFEIRTPEADNWMRQISDSPVVGAPGDYTPLVLDRSGRRLYLHRYWQYEQQLVAGFEERLNIPTEKIDIDSFKRDLEACFPAPEAPERIDWQKVAAFAALTRNICVITGGPGTGKTFTAAKIIRLLLTRQPDATVFLCAPTGKAAARLQASMAAAREEMKTEDGRLERFPETVHTIHRLLGLSDTGFGSRYNENHRLPADVVIIDEASMVSLSLMARLFAATDRHTRLILLGDRNQLASVEAGAVLGDICGAAAVDCFSEAFCRTYAAVGGRALPQAAPQDNTRLADSIVELKRNYRFFEGSSLDAVSRAVNRGDAEETCTIIDNDSSDMIVKEPLPGPEDLGKRLAQVAAPFFQNMRRAKTVEAALAALDAFRIVCAHRQGPYGVEAVNRMVEKGLAAAGGVLDLSEPFYRGRPVMITRNDYALNLYNGDVGIIWEDEDGNPQACFLDMRQGVRTLSPLRLPPHETVYAMTIHKSQGSEFDRLLMILPDSASSILTRELVYTGLTRARKAVTIWTGDDTLKAAVQARVSRRSGLRDALKDRREE